MDFLRSAYYQSHALTVVPNRRGSADDASSTTHGDTPAGAPVRAFPVADVDLLGGCGGESSCDSAPSDLVQLDINPRATAQAEQP